MKRPGLDHIRIAATAETQYLLDIIDDQDEKLASMIPWEVEARALLEEALTTLETKVLEAESFDVDLKIRAFLQKNGG